MYQRPPIYTNLSSCFRPKIADIPTVDSGLLASLSNPVKQADRSHQSVARPDDALHNPPKEISLSGLYQIRKKLDTRVIPKEATVQQPQPPAIKAQGTKKSVKSMHLGKREAIGRLPGCREKTNEQRDQTYDQGEELQKCDRRCEDIPNTIAEYDEEISQQRTLKKKDDRILKCHICPVKCRASNMGRHYKRQHKGKPFRPRELDDPTSPEEPDFKSKKGYRFTSGDDNPSRKR